MTFASWYGLWYSPLTFFSLSAVFLHEHLVPLYFHQKLWYCCVLSLNIRKSNLSLLFPSLRSSCSLFWYWSLIVNINITTQAHRSGSARMLLFLSCESPLAVPAFFHSISWILTITITSFLYFLKKVFLKKDFTVFLKPVVYRTKFFSESAADMILKNCIFITYAYACLYWHLCSPLLLL